MSTKDKILIILGPTASGKTSLSIKLAKKFNGQIISADSRQVYKGMNLGTGKVTKKEMQGIKHYLIDEVSPKNQFSVAQFVKKAEKAIKEIKRNNKLPIICGGTAFWIDALIYGLPKTVKPDLKLRKKLEKLSAEKLFEKLKQKDLQRAQTIDPQNKRRLVRALEIVLITGKPVPPKNIELKYDVLKIGVKREQAELRKLIYQRLLARLKQGMIAEVKKIHQSGVSWKRLDDFGLEYRWLSRYLRGQISKEEMIERLNFDIIHYAKRQLTWWKKDNSIIWSNNYSQICQQVKKWLFDKL